ncbi:MAG: MBL fold metallo-hydrolase [Verrucomicrobia bacterium]|nr:MBL fold metallo-hydrolase [Verrucomicrobiota bacterium]
MDITFLGTGTSLGIPVIGCQCEVCTSTDPRDQRSRASLYVRSGGFAFVVDTGPDFRAQCLRERIRQVDAVVYTHPHTDHIMGFDDLRPFCFVSPTGTLPIYAPPETMRAFERVFKFAFDGLHRYPGYLIPEPHLVEAPFELGGLTLTPLPVPHGKMTVTGYLFEEAGRPLFAYLPDCNGVPEPVRERIRGVDTLAIDALRRTPHPTHLSVAEALDVARDVGPRSTLLTHLSHDLGHAETEAGLPAGVAVAFDGLRLSF